jgi:AcrR family transcriptional regulator
MLDRRDLAVALEPSAPNRDPRQRILDALVRTVALKGYDRTTINCVLALAEVPRPVFEEHFEDKQDCLLAALDDLIGRVECLISEQVDGRASWPERVRIGLQTLLAALASHPDGARVTLVECLSAGQPAIVRLRRALANCAPLLEEGLGSPDPDSPSAAGDAGAGGGESADTAHLPPQASEAIAGGIASILHRRVLEDHTAELPGLLPDLLYFALMPYLGHDRALAEAGSVSHPD